MENPVKDITGFETSFEDFNNFPEKHENMKIELCFDRFEKQNEGKQVVMKTEQICLSNVYQKHFNFTKKN